MLNAEEEFKKRPYRKLKLQNRANDNLERVKGFLKAHGHHIDSVNVWDFGTHELIKFIPFMKNLTCLEVYAISDAIQSEGSKVDLVHLEELHATVSNSDIIKFIGKHKIKKLTIDGSDAPEKGNWKEFLASCEKLEELHLSHWFSFKLTDLNLRLIKFRLELGNFTFLFEELRAFLKSQVATLKVLEVWDWSDKHPDMERNDEFFAEFAAFELQLEEFDYYPGISVEMREQKFNMSLKKLEIHIGDRYNVSLDDYRKFFLGLQGIENLKMDLSTNEEEENFAVEILKLLAASMPKLRALHLSFPYESDAVSEWNKVRIEQVQEAHISCSDGWTAAILTMCPNVRKYTCNEGKISSADMEILVGSHKYLEEIYAREVEFNDNVTEMILASKIRKIGIEKKSQMFLKS